MSETNSGIVGEDRQSYFQVLERPSVHPGHCLTCGNVERRCVQLAPEVDYADLGYGALLICETCILQAASKFTKPATPVACDHAQELERWKQGFLDDLRAYITEYAVASMAVPVWRDRDSVPEQTESENDSGTSADISESDRSRLEAERNNRKQGSDRVSSDPDDGSTDDISRIFADL